MGAEVKGSFQEGESRQRNRAACGCNHVRSGTESKGSVGFFYLISTLKFCVNLKYIKHIFLHHVLLYSKDLFFFENGPTIWTFMFFFLNNFYT